MVIFYPQLELGSIHDDNSSSGGRYKYMLLADTTSINDDIREFKIYDAAGSTTRLRKKEICHARQKL
jgi:hypothetical protein